MSISAADGRCRGCVSVSFVKHSVRVVAANKPATWLGGMCTDRPFGMYLELSPLSRVH